MDSKVVNREIRTAIGPALKDAGFSAFTGRNSWRYHDDRVDVVNFQSFNSYNASVYGCTTYSFCINLGCYLPWIPHEYGRSPKEHKGMLRPQEYQCPMRGSLERGFDQPELDTRNIWYVDPAARYLASAIADARDRVLGEGLSWFEQFSSPEAILRVLQGQITQDRLWGFGNDPSPKRFYVRGYVALRCGEVELAQAELSRALESGHFDAVRSQLQRAIADCR